MADFDKINNKKREQIVNAAMCEFSTHGYQKTSTNKIVIRAGISKGSLFQYFGSKKQLFLYLFDLSHDLMQQNLYDSVNVNEPDILKRLENLAENLAELLQRYPEAMGFMLKAKKEKYRPIASEIDKRKKKSTGELMDRVFDGIDKSLFRKELHFEFVKFTLLSCIETYFSGTVPFPTVDKTEDENQKQLFNFLRILLGKKGI